MLPLDQALHLHSNFRDHVAEAVHGTHEKMLDAAFSTVLLKSFTFCFNTYKAIGLLLPERYYEQGSALLRIMWEASLNLAWVSGEPRARARAFLQFTVVETVRVYRNRILECEREGNQREADAIRQALQEYEKQYQHVLDEYRAPRQKGNSKLAQRFSLGNLGDVAAELGPPWSTEYWGIYPLLCAYAHGSPGVVIFPKPFVADLSELNTEAFVGIDEPRTTMLALWSMALLERSYVVLLTVLDIDDSAYLNDLDRQAAFRASLASNAA